MASEAAQSRTLENAFELFNQQSGQLETAYRSLTERFAALQAEYAALRRARRKESREHDRIGSLLLGLIEALPAAVIVIDGNGIIGECNSRAVRLLNSPLIGVAWSVVANREFCRGASRDGGLKLRSGQWLSLSRQVLDDGQGEILLLADISEARGNAELVGRAERLASLGEMTASLGHQIRTPLASAVLCAERLERSDDDEHRRLAASIGKRLRDIGALVDDMLNYAGGVTRAGDTVAIATLLHDVVDTVMPQVDAGTTIRVEIADESLAVVANRAALKGALLNLVTNAMQACGDDPVIELSAVRTGDRVCLTVTDNGRGICSRIRHRVFDPFFTTRPQGTGLGLAVVRTVAEAHGGEVLLQPNDTGTSIALCIPGATVAETGAGNQGDD